MRLFSSLKNHILQGPGVLTNLLINGKSLPSHFYRYVLNLHEQDHLYVFEWKRMYNYFLRKSADPPLFPTAMLLQQSQSEEQSLIHDTQTHYTALI